MTRIDWPQLMRAGLRAGGLKPAEFWALTPAELVMMFGRDDAAAPLTRSGLAQLIAAFPDEDTKGHDDGRD